MKRRHHDAHIRIPLKKKPAAAKKSGNQLMLKRLSFIVQLGNIVNIEFGKFRMCAKSPFEQHFCFFAITALITIQHDKLFQSYPLH